jgi:hypothetical protein
MNIAGCREFESLCRQRAVSDCVHFWNWLGEADRWNNLAHREIASRFQNNPMTPVPWVWDRTPSKATRTDKNMSRCSGSNLWRMVRAGAPGSHVGMGLTSRFEHTTDSKESQESGFLTHATNGTGRWRSCPMLTSAQCRVNAKKSLVLGKSAHVSLRRRTQALSMALKWTALAEGIDRDDAKRDADDPMKAAGKWING